jgi:hypothetical protein
LAVFEVLRDQGLSKPKEWRGSLGIDENNALPTGAQPVERRLEDLKRAFWRQSWGPKLFSAQEWDCAKPRCDDLLLWRPRDEVCRLAILVERNEHNRISARLASVVGEVEQWLILVKDDLRVGR